MNQPIYIDRPPRIQPELPFDEIEIPAPPEKQDQGNARLVQVSLPMITIIGYILVGTLGGVSRNPMFLIPMALSVMASVAYSIYSFRKEKLKQAELEQAYADRLIEMTKEMNISHDVQRRFYRYNYPDRLGVFRVVHSARAEVEKADRTLRSESRLWERRIADDDFGVVRLGMGTLPSTVTYVMRQADNFEDPQVRDALKLEEDSAFVSDIPVIISLRPPREEKKGEEEDADQEEKEEKEVQASRTPTTHALGIAGDPSAVYNSVRAMLAHFLVFHSPGDTRLFVLANRRAEWAWAANLPHSQKDEQSECLCFIDDIQEDKDAEKAFDEDEEGPLGQYLEGIRKILAQRKIRMQENDENKGPSDPTLPFLLVVVDLLDATYDENSPLKELQSDAAMSILLEEGAQLGAAVIFLVPERSKVPGGCTGVIEIERTTPATNSRLEAGQKLHFRYAEVGVNSFRYVGKADYVSRPEEMLRLSHQLAQLRLRESFGANLNRAVMFLDMMGYNSLVDLEMDTWHKWQDSVTPKYANWLRCKIGMMGGNKPRTLTFSAKKDGVHGMVAGSTGSGKSELLISMISAMVVTYDPTVLNFVLVDYKGGGAFKGFEKLPHCVDIITNLEAEGVTRMFTAIQSEMRRRQALNAETETKNIVEYRQKGLHKTYHPYPFLFIIIDEFAEMIADRAEFKGQLESITRVGRAQGVSLILAAQRPTGVTDQMRSNIKFRVSLRVETPAESREMLRRSEAAFLPSDIPGRGYLQVGNEEIELIQAAYTGEKVIDPNRTPQAKVIWPARPSYDASQDQEPPELYKAIVSLLDKMARDHGIEKQRAPWPEFLPARLSLSELLVSPDSSIPAVTSDEYLVGVDAIMQGQARDEALTLNPSVNKWLNGENGWLPRLDWSDHALRPVTGLVDNPYAAKQLPLVIELPRGHVAVFGASGWGKTTFLRTLTVSLAASHSPNDLHIYLLDLGGRNLGVLENLPHVGSVIIPDAEGYEERVEQLLRELDDIIEQRKVLLNNAGVPDLYKYNEAYPDSSQPAILVAIDNFIEFKETFGSDGDVDVETVYTKFIGLARQSKAYGIHFVITVNELSVLSSQLQSLFTERLTLKLSEPSEYRAIVGGHVSDIGDIPGRGYVKISHLPLSFQVAQPIDLRREGTDEQANETHELEQFAQSMQDFIAATGYQYQHPRRVDALPRSILFKQILSRQFGLELNETFLTQLKEQAGQNWQDNLKPEMADWLKGTMGVISGNRLREMHFEAKKDGVHGMIAGGTGSGKSELLMTMIVGLALNYHPSVLNFVLVDYKGGGAFQPFLNLPHCVDTITNLNKSAVKRFFTAINAEMQRRQKLNADTATKDIVEYRAKGYHLSKEPYPHLFIIVDEYAEMITDNPEFKDELDSITRVGRAQGVNLILASQRPTGVSDQMRANIKFRICLRVEQVDTSREMLRRSDAAFLPNGMPGRGYLQIGNENVELIQMAYTGENYEYAEVREGGRQPKFYDVIVDLCNELLQEERPRTPWPPFLPTQMTLSSPLVEAYLDPEYAPLMTMTPGKSRPPTMLNPFVRDWFNGQVAWHGVNWQKNAMRGIVGLADDPYNARQLPLVIDVTKGHVVLFGSSGWGKTTFMRTLIASLAATHSPDEFHAHILDLGGRNLEVLRALPQVGTVIMPDERGYEERVQQILRELNDIVDERKRTFSEVGVSTMYEYNISHPDSVKPAILVVIDNFAEFLETFGDVSKQDSEDNLLETFILLVRQAKAYGLHFVISVNRLNELSSKLYSLFTERLTLRLSDSGDYRAIVGGAIAEIDEIAGRGFVKAGRQPLEFQIAFAVGDIDDQGQMKGEVPQLRELGKQMHELGKDAWSGPEPLRIDALPKSSSYRQVLSEIFAISPEHGFLDELKTAMGRKWAETGSAEHADWLTGVLGITSGNRKRTLHMSAKTDGVHGMIAGGTGSGKSEMLMTMIMGLVAYQSPDVLNFVLVDYKGGGAFKPFETLPHVVDIVTNLNKAAVDRMFTAINAEIRRRQALNAETGTKDIIEYRRKGLHLSGESYPHLFVIIDEYAEMIDDNPEYRAELESITRVGRAQGVNLILASQRPKGVSDQMRANIKLRICLRVEQIDTSREMLRSPDAAFLPNGLPGRGYIQVGNDNLELIQVSYTGENQPDDRDTAALWPGRPAIPTAASEDVPKLFDAIVKLSTELVDGQMAPKPWPNFLPTQFSLQSPINDAQHNSSFVLVPPVTDWLNGDTTTLWPGVNWRNNAMRPVMGLLDNPGEARQEPLVFDLNRNHLAVFGDSGWGKTSFLRTMLVSLTATHSPDELHVYILDLGGRNFRSFEDMPHVGAVIYADEEAYEERLQRILDKLNRLIEERQQTLSNADANSLYEYNEQNPDESLPATLVLIDNFPELQENYEMLVESLLMPLVRRSLSMGVTFVVTANVPNNMPSKLSNLFGERITFKQGNSDRYMDIVGRGAIEIDDIAGRGYIRVGRQPLLFHTALPVGIFDPEDGRDTLTEADEFRLIARNMRHQIDSLTWRNQPEAIRILPEIVPMQDMLNEASPAKPTRLLSVLGQDSRLKPAMLDLKRMGPHFAVVGPPLSGKTTVLYNWVLSLADRYSPEQVKLVLIDMQRKLADYDGQHSLAELPHVLTSISEVDEMEGLLGRLKNEGEVMAAENPGYELFIIIDNYDDLSEEIERIRDLPKELAGVARRYGRDGIHFIIGGTLDSGISELRRRVQASNYGIGLRTAQAVETLRVSRTPSEIRGKELPVGRGYIVKAGQPTMIQVATPYVGKGIPLLTDDDDDDDSQIVALALDKWVEKLIAKYPEQQATWATAIDGGASADQPLSSQQNEKLQRLMSLLQLGMRRELARLEAGDDNADLVTARLVDMDMARWTNEEALMELLKEVWKKEKRASGLPEEVIDMTFIVMDDESILLDIEALQTPIEGDEQQEETE
jgi:S-DNA-T family DNA segregation ATPase FtsK/SpoIIIE